MSEVLKLRIRNDKHFSSVVRKAYDLSEPVGMGFAEAKAGPLPADEEALLREAADGEYGVYLDYVVGRRVKLRIHRDDDGLFVYDDGFLFARDHGVVGWNDLRDVLINGETK